MKDIKIQWHPGFVAAMNLEFAENRDDLIFDKEHNLNTKPLEIDLLVIKKNPSVHIENEIGDFFKGHNIMEYKSPNDQLNIDTFHKAMAYAHLYKAYGNTVDEIKADDITLSIVREAKPDSLFRYFQENGVGISKPNYGIYHVLKEGMFPVQIIVSSELDENSHTWLRALSDKMKKRDIRKLLEVVRCLTGKMDREYADSILEVTMEANRQLVEELRGDGDMSPALLEIMEPEISKIKKQTEEQVTKQVTQQVTKQVTKKGILSAIGSLRDFGHSDDEIRAALMKHYQLSEEEAAAYL